MSRLPVENEDQWSLQFSLTAAFFGTRTAVTVLCEARENRPNPAWPKLKTGQNVISHEPAVAAAVPCQPPSSRYRS
jgi:hypothetical protein